MAETKVETMTTPVFVYDDTKDPIEQLQNYIFENKLLFNFYLDEIKKGKPNYRECFCGHDHEGNPMSRSYFDALNRDNFLFGVSSLRGYKIEEVYFLYFVNMAVCIEKNTQHQQGHWESEKNIITWKIREFKHEYSLNNLYPSDMLFCYEDVQPIDACSNGGHCRINNIEGGTGEQPSSSKIIEEFFRLLPSLTRLDTELFSRYRGLDRYQTDKLYHNILKFIMPVNFFRTTMVRNSGCGIINSLSGGPYRLMEEVVRKLHKKSERNRVSKFHNDQILLLQSKTELILSRLEQLESQLIIEKNKNIELDTENKLLKEKITSKQVCSPISSTSSSLDEDIEAILNDSYVVKSDHSKEEIKTEKPQNKRKNKKKKK